MERQYGYILMENLDVVEGTKYPLRHLNFAQPFRIIHCVNGVFLPFGCRAQIRMS